MKDAYDSIHQPDEVSKFEQEDTRQRQRDNQQHHENHLAQQFKDESISSSSHWESQTSLALPVEKEQLAQVATLYDKILELNWSVSPQNDARFKEDFDNWIRSTIQKLWKTVDSTNSKEIKTAIGLKTEYDLYDICFEKLIIYTSNKDPWAAKLYKEIYLGS